jgi:hypothetical protein
MALRQQALNAAVSTASWIVIAAGNQPRGHSAGWVPSGTDGRSQRVGVSDMIAA